MAEGPEQHEKTEEPTQKKLEDARKKGDVPKSQEVTSWFMLLSATLLVMLLSGDMTESLGSVLRNFLAMAHEVPADGANLRWLAWLLVIAVGGALAFPALLLWLAGIAGNVIQFRPVLTTDPLKPKLSRISPLAGVKRIFSAQGLANFLKGLAKLVLVAAVIAMVLWPRRDQLELLVSLAPGALLPFLRDLAVTVLGSVVAVMAVLALLDFAWQRHAWWKKQRMTIKEVRDEHKDMEGDPQVRAKIRQIRIERGQKRMMARLPEATVVITNPTHYAVALKYETYMNAPICLAKGLDAVALKIREVAEAHDVRIVENPPLARALYGSVELDQEIPEEHFRAVAEVIGYVMRLRERV